MEVKLCRVLINISGNGAGNIEGPQNQSEVAAQQVLRAPLQQVQLQHRPGLTELRLRQVRLARTTDDIGFAKRVSAYCEKMKKLGYSGSYVDLVSKSMHDLHKMGIEKYIPITLKAFDESAHMKGRTMRAELEKEFAEMVKVMGGDYKLAKDYFLDQKINSWSNRALAFKGFSLTQRKNILGDNYYLGWDNAARCVRIAGANAGEEGTATQIHPILEEYDNQLKKLARSELETEGINNPQAADINNKTNEMAKKYEKTMAACQALTAISLSRIKNIPGLNLEGNNPSLTLYRGTTFFERGGPQGIADSASLVRPHLHYIKANKDKFDDPYDPQIKTCSKGNIDGYILTVKVPICDVKFPYFLFPGISSDQVYALSKTQKESVEDLLELPHDASNDDLERLNEAKQASEKKIQDIRDKEVVCDLSHAEIVTCEEVRNGKTIAITDNNGNLLNRDAGENLGATFYGEELYGG